MSTKVDINREKFSDKSSCKSCFSDASNNKKTVNKIHELIFGNSSSINSHDCNESLDSKDQICYSWQPGNPPSVYEIELSRRSLDESFGFFLRKGSSITRVKPSDHGGYYERYDETIFAEPFADKPMSGLLPGDKLLYINHKDVSELYFEKVAEIIKNSYKIHLTIQPTSECSEYSERSIPFSCSNRDYDNFESMEVIPVRDMVTKRDGFQHLGSYINKFLNHIDVPVEVSPIFSDPRPNNHESSQDTDQRSIGSIMLNSYDSKYERVWYMKKGECCFAHLLSRSGSGQCRIMLRHNLNEITVNEADLERANPSSFDRIENLGLLRFINESSIVHTLSQRFGSNLIHTYADGVGLIHVNPMIPLNIYNELIMRLFLNCDKLEDMPPHIFSIAQLALSRILKEERPQSQKIILTGRSGSGKSKSLEHVLKYLIYATSLNQQMHIRKTFLKQIQSSLELLDAFTCSRTLLNTNSSRCIRQYNFYLDQNNSFSGIEISIYLLERCRVTRRPEIEPTFHVFYYFLAGLQKEIRKELMLTDLDEPNMFMTTLQRSQDKEIAQKMWINLCKAAECLEIDLNREFLTNGISRLLAIIYHLGNVGSSYEKSLQGSLLSGKCLFANLKAAEKAARLFGCSVSVLHSAIFNPAFSDKSQDVHVNHTPIIALEAFVNGLYHEIVLILINMINRCLNKNKSANDKRIILIDPPGLQIPSSGGRISGASFEDLLYNYANERILSFYKYTKYDLVKRRFEAEKLENSFSENAPTSTNLIHLIDSDERSTHSPLINNHKMYQLDDTLSSCRTDVSMNSASENCLFSMLDNAAKFGDEKHLIASISQMYHRYKIDVPDKEMRLLRSVKKEGKFTLNHCAGTVPIQYNINGWLQNCMECHTSRHSVELMKSTSNEFLRSLVKYSSAHSDSMVFKSSPINKSNGQSVCSRVKEELNQLMAILQGVETGSVQESAECIHWIHCMIPVANAGLCEVIDSPLAPNHTNLSLSLARFCGKLVRSQIRGLSMISILRMNKLGFPMFMNFPDFINRYKSFISDSLKAKDANVSDREVVENIIENLQLSSDSYHIGPTMIFLKSSAVASVERFSEASIDEDLVIALQSYCRKYLAKENLKQHESPCQINKHEITMNSNNVANSVNSVGDKASLVERKHVNLLNQEKEAKIIYKYKYEENEVAIRDLKEQLYDLNDTCKAEKALNTHLSLQLKDSKEQVQHLENEISRLRGRLVEIKTESLKSNSFSENDIIEFSNDQRNYEKQIELLKQAHQKEINSLKNELDDRILEYDRKTQELKKSLQEEETQNSEIHLTLLQTKARIKDLENEKRNYDKKVEDLIREKSRVEETLKAAQNISSSAQNELIHLREVHEKGSSQVTALKESLDTFNNTLHAVHKQIYLLSKDLANATPGIEEGDVAKYQESAQLTGLVAFVREAFGKFLDHHSKEVNSLKGKNMESEIELERLNDQLDMKVKTMQRMESTLEKLRNEANRANEERELDQQNLRAQNNQRLKNLEEQLDEAREERLRWQRDKRLLDRKIEDLNTQLTSSRAMAEAATNGDSEINKKFKKEILKLNGIIAQNESLIALHYTQQAGFRQTTKELRDKINELEDAKESVMRQNKLVEKELEECQQQLAYTETSKKELEAKNMQNMAEQSELISKLDETEEKIEDLTAQLRSMTIIHESERNRLDKLMEEITRLKEENRMLVNRNEELDKNIPIDDIIQPQVDLVEFQKLQSKIRDLENKLQLEDLAKSRLQNHLERSKENLEVAKSERDSLLKNEQNEKERSRKLQRQLKETREEMEILERRLADQENQKRNANNRISEQTEEIDSLRFRLREASKKVSELTSSSNYIENSQVLKLCSSLNYQDYVNSDEGNVSPELSDLPSEYTVFDQVKSSKEQAANAFMSAVECTSQN